MIIVQLFTHYLDCHSHPYPKPLTLIEEKLNNKYIDLKEQYKANYWSWS